MNHSPGSPDADSDQAREDLIHWNFPDDVQPGTLSLWDKSAVRTAMPTKDQLSTQGLEAVARGWLPSSPIITPTTRVLAVGSCFARFFVLWLAEHGFNKSMPQSPYNALLKFGSGFENPAV